MKPPRDSLSPLQKTENQQQKPLRNYKSVENVLFRLYSDSISRRQRIRLVALVAEHQKIAAVNTPTNLQSCGTDSVCAFPA